MSYTLKCSLLFQDDNYLYLYFDKYKLDSAICFVTKENVEYTKLKDMLDSGVYDYAFQVNTISKDMIKDRYYSSCLLTSNGAYINAYNKLIDSYFYNEGISKSIQITDIETEEDKDGFFVKLNVPCDDVFVLSREYGIFKSNLYKNIPIVSEGSIASLYGYLSGEFEEYPFDLSMLRESYLGTKKNEYGMDIYLCPPSYYVNNEICSGEDIRQHFFRTFEIDGMVLNVNFVADRNSIYVIEAGDVFNYIKFSITENGRIFLDDCGVVEDQIDSDYQYMDIADDFIKTVRVEDSLLVVNKGLENESTYYMLDDLCLLLGDMYVEELDSMRA